MKAVRAIFVSLAILGVLLTIGIVSILAILFIWLLFFKHRLFVNTILLFTAVVLVAILAPLGYLYEVIKTIFSSYSKVKDLAKQHRTIAYSLDQSANVVMSELFTDSLCKGSDAWAFGNPDMTVSDTLGRNYTANTLTFLGKKLNAVLNVFEEDHTVKAYEEDEV